MYSQHPYKALPCLPTETSIIILLLLGIGLLWISFIHTQQ